MLSKFSSSALLALVLDPVTGVLFLLVLILSRVLWSQAQRPEGLPPGPSPALPVIGHMHLMGPDMRKTFALWRKRYGDVFCFYQGPKLAVVLNGYETIKEALVKNADCFSIRPRSFITDICYKRKGISGASGQQCKEQRKISLEILGKLGMGKNWLQTRIQEEIEDYLQAVRETKGDDCDLWDVTHVSSTNIICSILMGERFQYGDPKFIEIIDAQEKNLYDSFRLEALSFIPYPEYIPGDPLGWHSILSRIQFIEDSLLKPRIREHVLAHHAGQEYTDFLGGYVQEMFRLEKNGHETSINEEFLVKTMTDLWAAGTLSAATTIMYAFIELLHHEDVQEKCHQELTNVVGTDRAPNIQDRANMPYMEAFIMETMRMIVNVPFVPHGVAYDITFKGFLIPEGTTVYPNLVSALHDPEVWDDPETFRPERFIGPAGELIRPDEFIPFSLGRRACLGKRLADMELFLYLTNLIQRFKFLPPSDGQLPSRETTLGIVAQPARFKMRAVPRF